MSVAVVVVIVVVVVVVAVVFAAVVCVCVIDLNVECAILHLQTEDSKNPIAQLSLHNTPRHRR